MAAGGNKVKPNIVYPDAISGNPRAVVEVRAAPDGNHRRQKLIQSSGNKAWDDAVLRALEKTETLPRDVDGRAFLTGDWLQATGLNERVAPGACHHKTAQVGRDFKTKRPPALVRQAQAAIFL